jgi:hypothetical protein
MGYQTGLANACRRRGLVVEEYKGWTTRGSSSFNPKGGVCHWTAGPCGATGRPSLNTVVNGRSDLDGPLANVYLDRAGIAVVVAAGKANHAGDGGWRGLVGNSKVFGTEAECCHEGDWTDAQRVAYPKINAAYCDLGAFGPEMICGHNEWAPGRKRDIEDWPMALMRQQVSDLLVPVPTPEDPFAMLTDAQLVYLVVAGGQIPAVLNLYAEAYGPTYDPDQAGLGYWIDQSQKIDYWTLRSAFLGAVAADLAAAGVTLDGSPLPTKPAVA